MVINDVFILLFLGILWHICISYFPAAWMTYDIEQKIFLHYTNANPEAIIDRDAGTLPDGRVQVKLHAHAGIYATISVFNFRNKAVFFFIGIPNLLQIIINLGCRRVGTVVIVSGCDLKKNSGLSNIYLRRIFSDAAVSSDYVGPAIVCDADDVQKYIS